MFRSSLARPALLFALLLPTLFASAQSPAPTFTVTTSKVSLSTTGTGSLPFTVTAVNGYTGKIIVTCEAPTVPAGVNIPFCGAGPVVTYTLDPSVDPTHYPAVSGSFPLFGSGTPMPAGFMASHNPMLAIFFVVALLSGLTLRRRSARRLTLPLLLVMLGALSCTTGCGTTPHGFTPGTYTYVIGATQTPNPYYLGANATVTIH